MKLFFFYVNVYARWSKVAKVVAFFFSSTLFKQLGGVGAVCDCAQVCEKLKDPRLLANTIDYQLV